MLQIFVENHSPAIIIGIESWIDETCSNSEVFPPTFNAIRKDSNINGGGVFVATRSDIISVHQVHHLDTECEIVWVDPGGWSSTYWK